MPIKTNFICENHIHQRYQRSIKSHFSPQLTSYKKNATTYLNVKNAAKNCCKFMIRSLIGFLFSYNKKISHLQIYGDCL